MSATEKIVIDKFKEQLSNNEKIPENLIAALTTELEKDKPNAEIVAGIIKLNKEHLAE